MDAVFEDYRNFIAGQLEGYWTDWTLLNASDYGVPQLRPRVNFVAIRKGLKHSFSWPIPRSRKAPTVGKCFVAQVTHLAQANYFFFGWSGVKPDRDVKAIGSITTKDEAVAALEASFVYAHKALATITTENAFVAIKPIDGFSTRTTIAAFAAAHGNDHYGQMVEYLRMNDIVPPASAK